VNELFLNKAFKIIENLK